MRFTSWSCCTGPPGATHIHTHTHTLYKHLRQWGGMRNDRILVCPGSSARRTCLTTGSRPESVDTTMWRFASRWGVVEGSKMTSGKAERRKDVKLITRKKNEMTFCTSRYSTFLARGVGLVCGMVGGLSKCVWPGRPTCRRVVGRAVADPVNWRRYDDRNMHDPC